MEVESTNIYFRFGQALQLLRTNKRDLEWHDLVDEFLDSEVEIASDSYPDIKKLRRIGDL